MTEVQASMDQSVEMAIPQQYSSSIDSTIIIVVLPYISYCDVSNQSIQPACH